MNSLFTRVSDLSRSYLLLHFPQAHGSTTSAIVRVGISLRDELPSHFGSFVPQGVSRQSERLEEGVGGEGLPQRLHALPCDAVVGEVDALHSLAGRERGDRRVGVRARARERKMGRQSLSLSTHALDLL